MYVKETILPLLTQYHVPYHLYAHEAIAHGDITVELPAMQGTMLKNLVLTNKHHDLYLFTLPLDYRADLKALSKGHLFHYVQPVELDQFDLVNCHPLDNHFSIDIKRTDLEQLVQNSGHTVTKVPGAVQVPN